MFRFAIAAVLLAPLPAVAQQCPAGSQALPSELAGWGIEAEGRAGERLAVAVPMPTGRAVAVTLLPAARMKLTVAPRRAPAADSHGGFVAFNVARAGIYRVALSEAAWIEVLAEGRPVESTAHGHGPACSGIRKIVDFELPAGRHQLQISGAASPVVRVMVVPAVLALNSFSTGM